VTRHSVFLGDVAQDEFYVVPQFPQANDKVIVQALEPEFGGSVANAAAVYAHYGTPTSFIGQLNSGALTRKLLAQLGELGIDTRHVIFDEAVPDSHCIVLLHGEEHIVIIPSLGITRTELTPETFEHLATAEFVVTTLTDAKPLRMGELGAAEVLEALRARGAKIVVDLDVYNEENHGSGLVEHCDIVFMNSRGEERFAASGGSIPALLAGGATAVVVTKDSDGCELHTSDGVVAVPGMPVAVVDVTGAGDTFTSSFLHALSIGRDPVAAAEFANAAAALAVGKVGARAGMTTREAVDAFLGTFAQTTSTMT
jgi:sugar/nucleoside kinase (ribokinase family)